MTASLTESLKERLKQGDRASEPPVGRATVPDPPATEAEVVAAEQVLDFGLPPLLRQIYTEVSNGRFGPAYGLYGVPTKTIEIRRQQFWEAHHRRVKLPRDDPNWWPPDLVPAYCFDIVELYRSYSRPQADDPAWRWPTKLNPLCDLGCGMYMCLDCSDSLGPIIQFEPNPRAVGEPLDDYLVPIAPSIETWLCMRSPAEQ
jgi:hypothetical protein